MQRDRMAGRTAFTLRRHDESLRDRGELIYKGLETRRCNAIVVRDQNAHLRSPSSSDDARHFKEMTLPLGRSAGCVARLPSRISCRVPWERVRETIRKFPCVRRAYSQSSEFPEKFSDPCQVVVIVLRHKKGVIDQIHGRAEPRMRRRVDEHTLLGLVEAVEESSSRAAELLEQGVQ